MASELYTSYQEAYDRLQPNSASYLLIVTRGHKDDMRVLAWAVRTDARYIGMIGSKRKVLSVYKALEREGYSPREFERVHAPVGLDIGALSPEEIAVSIAAELIAVRRGRGEVTAAPMKIPAQKLQAWLQRRGKARKSRRLRRSRRARERRSR